jgi:chloramphenicol 3-O phosphotransferase
MHTDFFKTIEGFDVFRIGLHTDLATLESRENARQNRPLGSAAQDFASIHDNIAYHLELNGTLPAAENTAKILRAFQTAFD